MPFRDCVYISCSCFSWQIKNLIERTFIYMLNVPIDSRMNRTANIYVAFSWIQLTKEETLVKTSGKPTPQGVPQDTIPTSTLLTTNGPPESPWHAPCPAWVNVQIWLSKRGYPVWTAAQSAFVRVFSGKNCSSLGIIPPLLTVPHPLKTADTPPPTKLALIGILATKALPTMLDEVRTRLMSFWTVVMLKSGWFMKRLIAYLVPPLSSVLVPTTATNVDGLSLEKKQRK